jgi:1-phosphofructokinase
LTQEATISVVSPSPLVTVTVEAGEGDDPEIHLHAGGQGFWVARMAAILGAKVTLCAPLGGETGRVLGALIEAEGVGLQAVEMQGSNGAYVHDRRGGERKVVAESPTDPLTRHDTDELYGTALAAGIANRVTVLTGSEHDSVITADFFRRLAADLRENDRPVVVDLSEEELKSALEGGFELLKIAHDCMIEDGYAESDEIGDLVAGIEGLRKAGARNVVVSRSEEPAIAAIGDKLLELEGPQFEPLDPSGTGDSMTAAAALGFATDRSLEDALRAGMAAGALNVTRRGLGSGRREDIEQLMGEVSVRDLDTTS